MATMFATEVWTSGFHGFKLLLLRDKKRKGWGRTSKPWHLEPSIWKPEGLKLAQFIVSLVSQLGFFSYSALKPRELPNSCIHCVLGYKQYGSAHGILSRCPWASLRSLNYASMPQSKVKFISLHSPPISKAQTVWQAHPTLLQRHLMIAHGVHLPPPHPPAVRWHTSFSLVFFWFLWFVFLVLCGHWDFLAWILKLHVTVYKECAYRWDVSLCYFPSWETHVFVWIQTMAWALCNSRE